MDGGEEVSGGLVVAGCDRAKLLEFGEEVFDQVARRVKMPIEFPGCLSVGLRWDHHFLSGGQERLDDPVVGVEGFVGEQDVRLHVWQQFIRAHEVVDLSAGQVESNRVSEGINQRMDLGAQSTSGSPDCLIFALFFGAPALC